MQNYWKKLILLIIITAIMCGFIFLLLPYFLPTINISSADLTYLLPSIIIFSSLIISNINRHNIGLVTKNLIIWQIALLLFVTLYVFRHELKDSANKILASIFPSYSFDSGTEDLIVAISNDGHFYIQTQANGLPIKFMFDTGATTVALSESDAKKIKINITDLNFNKKISTANGITLAAPVLLKELKIGKFVFYNINAYVIKGENEVSLLGMSIISKFKKFKLEKDILKLSY